MLYEFRTNPAFERIPSRLRSLYFHLAGFVDGEGSFSVSVKKKLNMKFGWAIDPCFQVYQHKKNKHILEIFQQVFQTGYIKPKSPQSPVFVYCISNRRTLKEKVVSFFLKYKLITSKWEDFLRFKEIIERMENKEHYNLEGFKKIISLACRMNDVGKQRKYSFEEIISSLGSSETIRRVIP